MNKTWLCLVGLILVSSSFQIALSSSDPASYDRMADINRDRTVDVNDLSRLGMAYGSNLMLPSENGKTVVTVLSFDREPPEVESARVALVDPETLDDQHSNPIPVDYTNSSGIATFDASPNRNYTAIAWSGSTHNYVNLTTNSLGEASALILVGEPILPPMRALPKGWVVVTLLDNETGSLYFWDILAFLIYNLEYEPWQTFYEELLLDVYHSGGVVVIPPSWLLNDPCSNRALILGHPTEGEIAGVVYSPDENGCANIAFYVNPP